MERIRLMQGYSDIQPHLSRINLLVRDMKKALAFYSLLGFRFKEGDEQQDYVEVKLPNGFRISWWKRADSERLIPVATPSGHCVEIAFRCPGRDGVDAAYQHLIEAGHASIKAPFDAPWGQRYAFVEDPDGNIIGLEEHRLDQ